MLRPCYILAVVAAARGFSSPASCTCFFGLISFLSVNGTQAGSLVLPYDESPYPDKNSPENTAHNGNQRARQVCFFSATLHSPEIARLADSICDRPTWVDLKGRDTVPRTVHHVVVRVDPDGEGGVAVPAKARANVRPRTDGAAVGAGSEGREEARAERLKLMKPQVREGVWCACATSLLPRWSS